MALPYMDHDLTGLLQNRIVKFSLPQIKCYLKQLLNGLRYLHENSVLHRDIKCSNILINNNGHLKITDFGLSRFLEKEKKEYTPGVVTRWYRPPELLLGATEYTKAIDIWGVGCICAEIFLKRPLFPGKSDLDQLEKISKLLGTINANTMPSVLSLPDFNKISLPNYSCTLDKHLSPYMNSDAVDLIKKMLSFEPSERISIRAALSHSFFKNAPSAALPHSLPSYPSSHELSASSGDLDRAPKPTPQKHAQQSSTYKAPHNTSAFYKRSRKSESPINNFESAERYYGRDRQYGSIRSTSKEPSSDRERLRSSTRYREFAKDREYISRSHQYRDHHYDYDDRHDKREYKYHRNYR